MHMRAGLLLAAVAALSTANAALTCRFDVQSKLVSTLDTPIVASSTSGSTSGSSDNGSTTKNHQTNTDGSRGTHSPDVGEPSNGGSAGGDQDAGSGGGATPTSTPTPTSKTPSPSRTTLVPSPSTTTRPTTPGGSGTGPASSTSNATTRHTTTDTSTRHLMEMAIEAGSSFSSRDGSMGHTVGSHNNTISTNSTSSADAEFTCDEEFYKQWDTLGLKCGDSGIDVKQAVAAAKCVIYSGSLGTIPGSTCVSICAFPACINNAWSYGANNGMSSVVYNKVGINSFLSSTLKKGLSTRLPNPALLLSGNTSLASTQQCDFAGSASFGACSCSALSVNGTKSVEAIKKDVAKDKENGIIPKDNTTTAGLIIAPTSQSLASVTIVMSSMAAVASSVVSSTTAASSSVAAVGANAAVVTIEVCQFTVMINQLQLDGKSSALAQFGKSMAFSAFTFLPFGKLPNNTANSTATGIRRLQEVNRASDSGIAQYSRTLGIREDMLFLVTLAGVVLIMGGLVGAFALVYFASGFFMDREVFYNKFFNKLVGLEVLVAVMCQYTIGVTGTYQIYFSFSNNNPTDPKCILAFVALLGLAIGIMVYGVVVVKKYENEIRDVGTGEHLKKPVCQRYGPLYEEYNYKDRFFFCAKMLVALVTGMATGYVGIRTKYQVSILLATQVIFFFYLEAKRPHHSKFAQTTTSFVTIMKIATLLLTFFLVTATAGLPSELQNGISLAIVGLNMVVLFLLMIRSLYTFWKKYQLQRDARYDQEDQSAAQEYFKDDTPANGVQRLPEAQDHNPNQRAQQQDTYAQQQQQQPQQGQRQYQQNQQADEYQPQYQQQNQQADQYQPRNQQQYQPQYEQEPSQRQMQAQPSQRQSQPLQQQPNARSRYQDDLGPTMQADGNQIHLQANNMHQSRTTSNVYADVSDPTVDERYNMRRPDTSRQYVANPNDRYLQGNDVVEL